MRKDRKLKQLHKKDKRKYKHSDSSAEDNITDDDKRIESEHEISESENET